MRAVIFAGGSIFDYEFVKSYIKEEDFIIAADSGFDHLKTLDIIPDIFIGDMDSVKSEIIANEIIRLEVMKDETDTESALKLAKEKGADEAVLFGATGTRIDHMLANVFLLKKANIIGITAVLIDEHNEVRYLNDEISIIGNCGDIVSIIPLTHIDGISTTGLYYTLNNDSMEFPTSRGVSNVMTEAICKITLKSGDALVIKSRD